MSENLYNKEILRLAAEIPLTKRLKNPDYSVTKTSRICGSRITVDVNFRDGAVSEYGQEIKACALGQASSSIMARHIIGKRKKDIEPVAKAMKALLAGEGEGIDGEWSEIRVFIPAREHKSRHSAILLPYDALLDAFESIEKVSGN